MKVIRITNDNLHLWHKEIQALEALSSYPFGDDYFKIDHGNDYLAFFDRLGETHYYAAIDGNRVIAVAAGVLRSISTTANQRKIKAWYLCDLKVHPDYRGQRIPLKMFGSRFLWNYLKCRKIYAISMNGSDPDKVPRLLSRFRWARFKVATQLHFYLMSFDQAQSLHRELESHLAPYEYISLGGTKDLIMGKTQAPMPLLHLEKYQTTNSRETNARHDYRHMLCLTHSHPLAQTLYGMGITHSASATVIQHGMDSVNWDFINSSEI